MTKKKMEKRPKDLNQLAKYIVDTLTSKHSGKPAPKKKAKKKA